MGVEGRRKFGGICGIHSQGGSCPRGTRQEAPGRIVAWTRQSSSTDREREREREGEREGERERGREREPRRDKGTRSPSLKGLTIATSPPCQRVWRLRGFQRSYTQQVPEEIVPVSQEELERGMQLLRGLPRMSSPLEAFEKPVYKGPPVTHRPSTHAPVPVHLQVYTHAHKGRVVSLHEAW